ncbi:hypothetical protein Tco_0266752 [Tanacetum coccineum]
MCHLDTTHHHPVAVADTAVDIVVVEVGTADNTDHTAADHNQVVKQVTARSGMDSKMAKTCYHSHCIDEEDDEKVKDETYLVAQASNEVCSESSYFSDENSSIDDLVLDNEYNKLCKIVGIKSLLEISLLEDMDSKSVHMVAASKVPMLKPGEFELWRMRIEQYIHMIDYALWEVIENGNTAPKTIVVEGVEKVIPPTTAEEKAQKRL